MLENKAIQVVVLLLAALFEVGGDALIRVGLRSHGYLFVLLGFGILGSYGLVLNQVPVDFSKLLGVYVGLFAATSVLFGRFVFHEAPALHVWLGAGIVLAGSACMQWG